MSTLLPYEKRPDPGHRATEGSRTLCTSSACPPTLKLLDPSFQGRPFPRPRAVLAESLSPCLSQDKSSPVPAPSRVQGPPPARAPSSHDELVPVHAAGSASLPKLVLAPVMASAATAGNLAWGSTAAPLTQTTDAL